MNGENSCRSGFSIPILRYFGRVISCAFFTLKDQGGLVNCSENVWWIRFLFLHPSCSSPFARFQLSQTSILIYLPNEGYSYYYYFADASAFLNKKIIKCLTSTVQSLLVSFLLNRLWCICITVYTFTACWSAQSEVEPQKSSRRLARHLRGGNLVFLFNAASSGHHHIKRRPMVLDAIQDVVLPWRVVLRSVKQIYTPPLFIRRDEFAGKRKKTWPRWKISETVAAVLILNSN